MYVLWCIGTICSEVFFFVKRYILYDIFSIIFPLRAFFPMLFELIQSVPPARCTHNPPVAPHFPPCTSVTWRGSPRLRCRNIQLMADSHGHFPHPFPSLGNNCSSVSAPLPLILYSRVEAARCHCQRCSVPEKTTHTTDVNSESCRWDRTLWGW